MWDREKKDRKFIEVVGGQEAQNLIPTYRVREHSKHANQEIGPIVRKY